MPTILRLCFAVLLLSSTYAVTAQEVPLPKANSPYSRFGVGDLIPFAYSAQLGMGGIGIGFHDTHIASPSNPAALAALRYTSFQVGVGLERSTLSDGSIENDNLNGNLQYLSLAFPLQNTLNTVLDGRQHKVRNAMMFSLAPYSNVGYNVELVSDEPGLGQFVNRFRGSGGYYRLQWGNAVEYKKTWRAGLNLSYIFGRTNNQQQLFARGADSSFIGASLLTDTDALRARGIEAQFGLQYDLVLASGESGPTKTLTFGASSTLGTTLKGEASRVITNENIFGILDTLAFERDESQEVKLPNQFGIGVMYRHRNKFSAGFDIRRVNWSGFSNSLRPLETGDNVTRLAAGVEWIPNYQAFGKYWNRVRYRAGAYLHEDPRQGVDPEYGVTFGLGLPIVQPREEVSYVNLSLNAGRFGAEGDITQRYVRLVVGFTLTDNSWFYKRRFN